jgi:ferric-dicitrate binding protein FerR (iron transport regulator)
MEDSRLIELLVKKKLKQLTLQEQRELQALLTSNAHFSFLSDTVDNLYGAPIYDETENEILWKPGEQLIKDKEPYITYASSGKNRRLVKFFYVAASVFVVLLISVFFFYNRKEFSGEKVYVFSTEKGSKSNIVLPDGTQVGLSSDTKVTYNRSFGNRNREITLSGEAHFEVVKDKAHPFIVHTQNLDVEVTGTVFNVRAYNNETSTQATLIEGAIDIFLHKSLERIALKPNEKIVVKNDSLQEIAITRWINPDVEKNASEAQKIDSLSFKSTGLKEIVADLEKVYNVKITVANAKIRDKKFSGQFKNKSFDEVLKALSIAGRFSYKKVNDSTVVIK